MDTTHLQRNANTGALGLGTYGLHPTKCRYCQASMGFVLTTATGSPMPLDWWENPAGNVRLVDVEGQWHALVIGQVELFPPDPDTRWMPHKATCPGPDYQPNNPPPHVP